MSAFRTLVESRQFGAGLVAGLLCGFGLLLAAGIRASRAPTVAARGRRGRIESPPPERTPPLAGGIGAAFVVATLAATAWLDPASRQRGVPAPVAIGVAMLFAAGVVAGRLHDGKGTVGALLAVPGGIVLAATTPDAGASAVLILALGPAVAGTAFADCDDRLGSSGTPALLFAVAVAAMYSTVPDTELARVVLGAAFPLTLLAWPFTLARFGRGGAYAAAGLFLWIATVDGAARPGSIVGSAACLGLLVVEPAGRVLAASMRRGRPTRPPLTPTLLFVSQIVLAYWCARVAGFSASSLRATAIVAPAVGVALAITTSRAPGPPRREQRDLRRAEAPTHRARWTRRRPP